MGHWIAWGTLFINIWHRFEFESVHMWRLFSTSHAYAQLQFEMLNGAQVRYAMNGAQVRYAIHISGFQSISTSHLAWQNHLTLIKYYFMHISTVSNFQLLKIMSESSVCSFIHEWWRPELQGKKRKKINEILHFYGKIVPQIHSHVFLGEI